MINVSDAVCGAVHLVYLIPADQFNIFRRTNYAGEKVCKKIPEGSRRFIRRPSRRKSRGLNRIPRSDGKDDAEFRRP